MSEEKRKETEKVLGVNKGHYFDISTELDSLIHINIGGKKNFFESGFPHIDNIYNLGNHQNVLFTYDHPNLRRKGQEIGEKIGHELIALPLEEASYASVGFVEFGHNAIVDRRAKKTQKILEDSGYNVIKTPHSLKETNKRGGSLRCMTNEIPIRKERFETLNPNNMEDKYRRMSLENNFLFTSKGEAVIESDALKLKVKD